MSSSTPEGFGDGAQKHSGQAPLPEPAVMPVDRQLWLRQINLSNFVNAFYQYRDLQRIQDARRVLIIGPGQGLDKEILKWRGYDIVTFDIDHTFGPDVVGSVHDLSAFATKQFDVAIASHVLEHLPIRYLDDALHELSRVARYAVVYLPVTGRTAQIRIKPGFLGIDWSIELDLFNYFKAPDPNHPRFCGGQHYWEVGRKGFTRRQLRRRFATHFDIVDSYRNRDWLPSINYILKSREAALR
jgi:hypothetical protein